MIFVVEVNGVVNVATTEVNSDAGVVVLLDVDAIIVVGVVRVVVVVVAGGSVKVVFINSSCRTRSFSISMALCRKY